MILATVALPTSNLKYNYAAADKLLKVPAEY